MSRSGRIREPTTSDQRPTPIRNAPASDLGGREHRRRRAVGEAALVVEVEDEEPHQRDLRDEVERTRSAGEQQTPVAQTSSRLAETCTSSPPPVRSTTAPTIAPAATKPARKRNPARGPPSAGSTSAATVAADRHRRLPDSEREPALAGAEPAHHRPAAPRLDAAAGGARRARAARRARRSPSAKAVADEDSAAQRSEPDRERPAARRTGRPRAPTAGARSSARSTRAASTTPSCVSVRS